MIDGFLALLASPWKPVLEVTVYRPVRGVIDLVLNHRVRSLALAAEAHSELRRVEQQLRWATAKADALAAIDPTRSVSRLLLLRATQRNRETVAAFPELFAAAYPANYREAVAALTGSDAWPGAALLWMDVLDGRATLRQSVPRGITLGR